MLRNKPVTDSHVNKHQKSFNYKINMWYSQENIVICVVPTCVGVIVLTGKLLKSHFFWYLCKTENRSDMIFCDYTGELTKHITS